MLHTGVAGLTLLASVGGMMSNYAWREAQLVEIDAALRASVSAVGNLLDGLNNAATASASEALIKDRVAKFLDGLLANVDVEDDNVTVDHESTSRTTRITIGGQATVDFDDLFGDGGGNSNVGLPTQTVAVQLLTDRYEIAVAADLTSSMVQKMVAADGTYTGPKRIDALKTAANVIEEVLAERAASDPGSMAVALVPFGGAVNVADTSGDGDTAGKRRYARMLTGAAVDTDEARATEHHWVDTFHDHGTGANMGPLGSRSLPGFYLGGKDADGNVRAGSAADWDLRADEDVDVSGAAPPLGTWSVNGEDFWNGCVMARWAAHWHPAARASNADNVTTLSWPATSDVAGWTPLSAGLTDEPLHLSDAPPDHADPHTRFTAYSWPDARIAANADMQLHTVMLEMLDDNARPATASTEHTVNDTVLRHVALSARYNNWGTRDAVRGTDGSSLCPGQAVLPLSDSAAVVGGAFDGLTVIEKHGARFSNTLLHLGVVWGLRALSPLWSDIWSSANANPRRPVAACAEGETADCDPNLKKSIVLITDGYPYIYRPLRGRASDKRSTASPANPNMTAFGSTYETHSSCQRLKEFSDKYGDAMADTTAGAFNARFSTFVDGATKEFTSAGLRHLADVVEQVAHPNGGVSSARKASWAGALSGLTPWQLFRGDGFLDGGGHVVDKLMAADLGLAGRPMLNDHICRRGLSFTPYGRPDDLARVGMDGEPVEGVAPFTRGADWTDTPTAISRKQIDLLNDWLLEACRIAGDRGVAVRVIFLNKEPTGRQRSAFSELEQCVDSAGGDPDVEEVITAPTEQELKEAFESVFRVKRSLRFLD